MFVVIVSFDLFTSVSFIFYFTSGTGRSKPYIDKKHFFQELKNPPKKVLNDLVNQTDIKEKGSKLSTTPKSLSDFESDPFGEDPFVSLDPFAETEFKQDPFEKDFNEYKKSTMDVGYLPRPLSKSPNSSALSSISLSAGTFKNVQFKDNPEGVKGVDDKDEGVPEPPPRPDPVMLQIKPPPLPPKKQTNEMVVKPPPRPPHIEDSLYGYMDNYATVPTSFSSVVERSPALPIPMRKSRFDSDSTAPERPVKQGVANSFEDDYLTPIQFTKPADFAAANRILLPSTNLSKSPLNTLNLSTAKEPSLPDSLNNTLDGLDITLSQLTLSGLNELAVKLNIPTNQLSNMTLAQLTEYLKNVIKSKSEAAETKEKDTSLEFPAFQADFETNFENSNSDNYDRYAAFRELMKEEIDQTKTDNEPVEIEDVKVEEIVFPPLELKTTAVENKTAEDRYAALREIVEEELMKTETKTDKKENETITNEVEPNEVIKDKIIEICEQKNEEDEKITRSPHKILSKSPISNVISEIIQTNTRLNSGSLSDIISGSSPEVDNIMGSLETEAKNPETTGKFLNIARNLVLTLSQISSKKITYIKHVSRSIS